MVRLRCDVLPSINNSWLPQPNSLGLIRFTELLVPVNIGNLLVGEHNIALIPARTYGQTMPVRRSHVCNPTIMHQTCSLSFVFSMLHVTRYNPLEALDTRLGSKDCQNADWMCPVLYLQKI